MTICKPRRNYSFLRDPLTAGVESPLAVWRSLELPSDRAASSSNPTCKTLAQKLKEKIDQAVSAAPKFLIRLKRFEVRTQ